MNPNDVNITIPFVFLATFLVVHACKGTLEISWSVDTPSTPLFSLRLGERIGVFVERVFELLQTGPESQKGGPEGF